VFLSLAQKERAKSSNISISASVTSELVVNMVAVVNGINGLSKGAVKSKNAKRRAKRKDQRAEVSDCVRKSES
jgi:hypothetical protein